MKIANLNILFEELISGYAHLVTSKTMTKNDFMDAIKKTYSLENQRNKLFFMACEKSDFDTIRLSKNRDSILFNQ